MATMTCPVTPSRPSRACWLRAWDRAKAEQLIPYKNADGTWSVKTYTVRVTGAGWSNLSCDCSAGSHARICKHAAVTAKAIACGVSPIRGSVAILEPDKWARLNYRAQMGDDFAQEALDAHTLAVAPGLARAIARYDTTHARLCCVIDCGKSAEWEIWSGEDSRDYTDACTDHVGVMLGEHAVYRVYAIAPVVLPQTAKCARNGCGESVTNAGEYCGMCLATMEDDAETEMDTAEALAYDQYLAEREEMDWDCVDAAEEPEFAVQEEEAAHQTFGPDPVHSRHLALTAERAARLVAVPPATWLPSGANDGFTRLSVAVDPLQGFFS